MTFALGPRAAQAGYRIRHYDSLDSTNSEAMRLAREGERGPVWIVADRQTSGRGRRGRAWISGDGNLTASVLLAGKMTPAVAARLGFVAALAALQTCCELAPDMPLALKWPNDVLAGDAKVAGILLESESMDGLLCVVAGFGINLVSAPEGTAVPAASLAAYGHALSAHAALSSLSDRWTECVALFADGVGFATIRKMWLEHACGIGRPVSVQAGQRIDSGIFETLDEDGRLVLRLPDGGTRLIGAGDVHFGEAATLLVSTMGAA